VGGHGKPRENQRHGCGKTEKKPGTTAPTLARQQPQDDGHGGRQLGLFGEEREDEHRRHHNAHRRGKSFGGGGHHHTTRREGHGQHVDAEISAPVVHLQRAQKKQRRDPCNKQIAPPHEKRDRNAQRDKHRGPGGNRTTRQQTWSFAIHKRRGHGHEEWRVCTDHERFLIQLAINGASLRQFHRLPQQRALLVVELYPWRGHGRGHALHGIAHERSIRKCGPAEKHQADQHNDLTTPGF